MLANSRKSCWCIYYFWFSVRSKRMNLVLSTIYSELVAVKLISINEEAISESNWRKSGNDGFHQIDFKFGSRLKWYVIWCWRTSRLVIVITFINKILNHVFMYSTIMKMMALLVRNSYVIEIWLHRWINHMNLNTFVVLRILIHKN